MKSVSKIFSNEQIIEIYNKDYCENKLSTIKIGEKYNLDGRRFRNWFNRLGLRLRSNKENSRKYTCNHNYFDIIDSHEKAYWLGYIFADGYISTNSNKYIVSLSSVDKDVLEKFKKSLNSTYETRQYTTNSGYKKGAVYYRVVIHSEQLYKGLITHGCVEKKSLILSKPKIDNEYANSFICGYFNGDGSIYVGQNTLHINIAGTKDLLVYIGDILHSNNIITKPPTIEKDKSIYCIRWGGNKLVPKILNYLYKDVDLNIVMDRKWQIYKQNCFN